MHVPMRTPLPIALLAAALLAASCAPRPEPEPSKENAMAPAATTAPARGVPPIDAEAPARLETATFALG